MEEVLWHLSWVNVPIHAACISDSDVGITCGATTFDSKSEVCDFDDASELHA